MKTTFAVEGFRCSECGLRIDGREEIAAAGLLESFEEEEVLEPHYEEEYKNE